MAAATAVFNTFELLENIVVRLPIADILTTSRVCRPGQSVLEQSRLIRRILSEIKLPGCGVFAHSLKFNDNKEGPWILRTEQLETSSGDPGRVLILSTPCSRFFIFMPSDSSKELICGIRLSVRPIEPGQAHLKLWIIRWTTGDGKVLGIQKLIGARSIYGSELLAYVETFYPRGKDTWTGSFASHFSPFGWKGPRPIFAAPVRAWGTMRMGQANRKQTLRERQKWAEFMRSRRSGNASAKKIV